MRRATNGVLLASVSSSDFYPRSPCGERRTRKKALAGALQFLSTLSLRRATMQGNPKLKDMLISIHALLAESDHRFRGWPIPRNNFYPRSPCGERPPEGAAVGYYVTLFLSTLSLRRATRMFTSLFCGCSDFYPRSPCGERQVLFRQSAQKAVFLSTLSLRRAT